MILSDGRTSHCLRAMIHEITKTYIKRQKITRVQGGMAVGDSSRKSDPFPGRNLNMPQIFIVPPPQFRAILDAV